MLTIGTVDGYNEYAPLVGMVGVADKGWVI